MFSFLSLQFHFSNAINWGLWLQPTLLPSTPKRTGSDAPSSPCKRTMRWLPAGQAELSAALTSPGLMFRLRPGLSLGGQRSGLANPCAGEQGEPRRRSRPPHGHTACAGPRLLSNSQAQPSQFRCHPVLLPKCRCHESEWPDHGRVPPTAALHSPVRSTRARGHWPPAPATRASTRRGQGAGTGRPDGGNGFTMRLQRHCVCGQREGAASLCRGKVLLSTRHRSVRLLLQNRAEPPVTVTLHTSCPEPPRPRLPRQRAG